MPRTKSTGRRHHHPTSHFFSVPSLTTATTSITSSDTIDQSSFVVPQQNGRSPFYILCSLVSALLCSLLAIHTYWETRRAGFVWDDRAAILGNADVTSVSTSSSFLTVFNRSILYDLWTHDFWGMKLNYQDSHKSWRPLCVLTFRLNYMYSEKEAGPYHVVNIFLHGMTTALVCWLTHVLMELYRYRQPEHATVSTTESASTDDEVDDAVVQSFSAVTSLSKEESTRLVGASVAGLLFAVHPIHVEAVSGLVSRADILAGLFSILAVLSYVHTFPARKNQHGSTNVVESEWSWGAWGAWGAWRPWKRPLFWAVVSMFFVICAALSKETGATTLAVLLLMECIQPPAALPTNESTLKSTNEGTVDHTAQQNARIVFVGGVISPLDDESTEALAFDVNVDTNVLLQKNIFFWGAQKTFQPAVVGSNGTVFAVNKESCGSKIEIPGVGMKREPKQDMKRVSAQTGTTSQNCVVSCPRDNKLAKTKTENGTILTSLSWARFLKRGPILDCGGSGDTATITDGAIDDSNKTIQDENVWGRLLHDSNRKVLFPKMISTAEINTKLDQHDLDLFHGPSLELVKGWRKNEEGKLSMDKMAIETTTKTVLKMTYHQQHCLEYDQRDMAQDLFIKWYVPFFFEDKAHFSFHIV